VGEQEFYFEESATITGKADLSMGCRSRRAGDASVEIKRFCGFERSNSISGRLRREMSSPQKRLTLSKNNKQNKKNKKNLEASK
jgi:hypothetical protein